MDVQTEQQRCLELGGRKACVSLESDFWECLEQIAEQSGTTVDRLAAEIGRDMDKDELSAVLRVFVLSHFQQKAGWIPSDEANDGIAEPASPYRMLGKRKCH
jgi:predicted DNA-binding ribbon-helix-helix protein